MFFSMEGGVSIDAQCSERAFLETQLGTPNAAQNASNNP